MVVVPNENQEPQMLPYRSHQDEPVPPSPSEVFLGLFFAVLCLASLALTCTFGEMAAELGLGFHGLFQAKFYSESNLPPSFAGPAIAASVTLFATFVLYRLARRHLACKRRIGGPDNSTERPEADATACSLEAE